MEAKHTPERLMLWNQDDFPTGCANFESRSGVDAIVLYHDNAKADAARIVACWNACADMADPAAEIASLRQKVEELTEAANALMAFRVGDLPGRGWLLDNDRSRTALAKLAALSASQGDAA